MHYWVEWLPTQKKGENYMNDIKFCFGDPYPNMINSTCETGLLANPDKDDQVALEESEDVSEKADVTSPTKSKVFMAVLMIALLVVLLGGVMK